MRRFRSVDLDPMVQRSRHRPVEPRTRVRFPLGAPDPALRFASRPDPPRSGSGRVGKKWERRGGWGRDSVGADGEGGHLASTNDTSSTESERRRWSERDERWIREATEAARSTKPRVAGSNPAGSAMARGRDPTPGAYTHHLHTVERTGHPHRKRECTPPRLSRRLALFRKRWTRATSRSAGEEGST